MSRQVNAHNILKWNGIFLFVFLLILCSSVPLAHAEVVVFDRYNTKATITGDSILVERDVRIRNTGKTPIIPGELHFKLFERKGGENIPIPVKDFVALSGRGESLGTKMTEHNDETDLSVQLWNPLLPGFSYEFTMSYEMQFDPSGILFYEINLPHEETTIPITNEETSFVLSDGYHITYAPQGTIGTISGNSVVTWQGAEKERVVEYSKLPLPRIGIRAVNIFWMLVIIVLAGIFVMSVYKRKQSGRSRPPQYQQQFQQQWQGPPQGPPGGWG